MLRDAARATLIGLLVVLVASGPARAEEQQPGGPVSPSEPPAAAVNAGQAAPFSGVLVPPGMFAAYLSQQQRNTLLTNQLKTRDDLLLSCAKDRDACQASYKVCASAIGPRSLLDRWWVGALGVIILAGAGVGTWYYVKNRTTSAPTTDPTATTP